MRRDHPRVAAFILLAGVAALFACGLPGSFMLDDFPNLSGLEHVRQAPRRAIIYLTEGAAASFPGRALSYLSFLLQRASWPDDPRAFKVVNIVLHLINGALVCALVAKLMSLRGHVRAAQIGLIAAGIWLVHPIQVSTVLYVVQRMTELAALFTLCGFLAYLKGRSVAIAGSARRGYAWMSAGVALGTSLAILGKESGVLLPVFIAVIEFTVLAQVPRPPRWKLWAAGFLALPPIGLAAYLALTPGTFAGYAFRPFTLEERLYTQAVVLWDYLGKIALPRPRAFGLYFDDYPVAAAPWVSLATAAALAAWGAAMAIAVVWRKKLPVLSFAILWFLSGHLLESTALPLELYFEHRNYLPLIGPALALAWGAARLWEAASSSHVRRVYAALGVAGVAALTAVTWMETRAWSDPVRLAVYWAREHPASPRAQHDLGSAYMVVGRYAEANETFERAQALAPEDAHFLLARLLLGCLSEDVALPGQREAQLGLARTPLRPVIVNLLDDLVQRMERGECARVDLQHALALVGSFLSNPRAAGSYRRDGLYLRGRLHAAQGNLDGAVRALEAADRISPSLVSVQLQAAWLLSADLYDDALHAIERGRIDPRWRPWQRALYAPFFDSWKRQVREAASGNGVALRGGT